MWASRPLMSSISRSSTVVPGMTLDRCLPWSLPSLSQRSLERRLHLHLPELGDHEIQVLPRFVSFSLVQQKLSHGQAGQRPLGAEPNLGSPLQRALVVVHRRGPVAEQRLGPANEQRYAL